MKTAAVIVIGNEILSGKVTESNAGYLSKELRDLGVDLRRIEIVPDEVDKIAHAVSIASDEFDYVFTSGGVGPTHDDVTMRGIAEALDVGIERNEDFEETMRKFYGGSINEYILRMADLPAGSSLLWEDDLPIPVICARNIYVFPGEPGLLKKKFQAIRSRFRSEPYFLHKIFTTLEEGDIAKILEEAAEAHPAVQIGSYPVYSRKVDYRVQVTIESKDENEAREVTDFLKGCIPAETILRVE